MHSESVSNRRLLEICTALAVVALSSCSILLVSGPIEVETGTIVTYVLEVSGSDFAETLWVSADVPPGWNLLSSHYEGTFSGSPVSGSGTVVGSAYPCDEYDPQPDSQRIRLEAGPFPANSGESSATVTLEFYVASQPAGEYRILFWFGGEGTGSSRCSDPVIRTINRDPFGMSFLNTLFDGQDGTEALAGVSSIADSPQGDLVVAAGPADNSLAVLSRSPETGQLTFLEALTDGVEGVAGLGEVRDVEFSPDGNFIYAVGANPGTLAVLQRVGSSFLFVQSLNAGDYSALTGAIDVEVHQSSVYTLSDGAQDEIGVFSRDLVSGVVSFVQSIAACQPEDTAFYDGIHLSLTPDGRNLLVPSSGLGSVLTVYSRDDSTGMLSLLQSLHPIDGPSISGLAYAVTSWDGRHVYTAAGNDIGILGRDLGTGMLTHLDLQAFDDDGFGSQVPLALAICPGDETLYVSFRRQLIALQRDPGTGSLNVLDGAFHGDPPVPEFGLFESISATKDCRHIYAASEQQSSISAFTAPTSIFADGFETGDLAVWSFSSP